MKIQKTRKSVGVLFPNQKTKERSPNMTGKIPIQYEDMAQLGEQVHKPGDVALCNVALWYYPADIENGKGPYVSVQLTPPFRPMRKSRPEVDQETGLDDFFDEVGCEGNHD